MTQLEAMVEQGEAPTGTTVTGVARQVGIAKSALRRQVLKALPDYGIRIEGRGDKMFDPEAWKWVMVLEPAKRALRGFEVGVVEEVARQVKARSDHRNGRCVTRRLQ